MRRAVLLVSLLPALACAAELRVEGDKLLSDGRPVALRGLVYPFLARCGGVRFDPATVLAEAHADGLNAILADTAESPGSDDAARLHAEAETQTEPCFTFNRGAAPCAVDSRSALFAPGLSYGAWSAGLAARRRAAAGPLLAVVEAAPPDSFVGRHLLHSAAPQPDLYRDARQRPAVSARFAGEYLFVPEPAQIRLATYAALAAGVRGVLFDHAGHLCDGPDPFNGVDRRLTVRQLCAEMAAMERFIAGGEALRPPRAVAGVATGLLALGRERLLLAYRNRPLDSRSVGGAGVGPFTLDVPVDNPAGLHVYALDPAGLKPLPADLREGALRISVDWLDLTAAWLITPEPVAELAKALGAVLPETAARAIAIASHRWLKVDATLKQLEAAERSAGGRAYLRAAADSLTDAVRAQAFGYHRTALEGAREADRLERQAEAAEYEAALEAGGPADEARICFATLPALVRRPVEAPDVPYAWRGEQPLRVDFELLPEGALPERWRAMPGYDQTVETLQAVVGGAGGSQRCLRWTPAGGDSGALGLAFSPSNTVEVSLQLRLSATPAGERRILLAPGPLLAPLGGVVLASDGTVRGDPAGTAVAAAPGGWVKLVLRVAKGRLEALWDGRAVTPPGGIPVERGAGALVLAKRAGADPVPIDLDDVQVGAPSGAK